MFGALGSACKQTCFSFVSRAAAEEGIGETLGLQKRIAAVKHTRSITKKDMVHNNFLPVMEVDPQTYQVRADGELLVCEPSASLPLTQRYFLF